MVWNLNQKVYLLEYYQLGGGIVGMGLMDREFCGWRIIPNEDDRRKRMIEV
jgi:hypothetical protein